MRVQSYLFLDGRCEEALGFYRRALDAEVTMMMRNRESPDPHPPGMLPPGSEDKIMHAEFRVGDTVIMAYDGLCSGKAQFTGFSRGITVAGDETAVPRFDALAEGGAVQIPLGQTFFATSFGMVQDRFGIGWMVLAPKA